VFDPVGLLRQLGFQSSVLSLRLNQKIEEAIISYARFVSEIGACSTAENLQGGTQKKNKGQTKGWPKAGLDQTGPDAPTHRVPFGAQLRRVATLVATAKLALELLHRVAKKKQRAISPRAQRQ
jgi:hypothetical protein